MKTKAVTSKVLASYSKVRRAIKKTDGNLEALFNVIKKCNEDDIRKYALFSSNSAFNELTLQIPSTEWDHAAAKDTLQTLLKLPNVVYNYEGANKDSKTDFDPVLEKALTNINADKLDIPLAESLLEEIRNTSNYVVTNSLDMTYKSLNPQIHSILQKWIEKSTMETIGRDNINFFMNLAYIARIHSLNLPQLDLKLKSFLRKGILSTINKNAIETLYISTNPKNRNFFEEGLENILKTSTFDDMANIFHIISSYSNDTYRIKLVLSVYWTFLRKNFGTASDNLPSMESLINLMKGVFVLKTRTQDSGLVTASNNLLTSIWKYIDKRLEGFGTNELVLISSVYFDTISEKKKTSAKFNADLSSKVLHEIDKKFDDFILSHLITIIEHTHKIRHFPLHVVSVDGSSKDPDTSSSKEYTCVDQIKEKWVRKLSDNLVNLTTNDLADAIYSLSLHHSSLLCQYLISHDLYITPVSTVIENRIKFLFGQDDKNKKDYLSLARLFLTLPEDSELRETFREINTEKVFKGLSANNILELFYISKYVPETTKILSLLAEKVALGHIQLSSRDIHFILENIDNFKDKKVVTDLILYHISGYTFSKPKEYFELLNISKYFSRFSVEDIPGMQDLIFSNLFKFLPSCSMEELELIFRYVSRSTIKDEEIESILSRLLNVDVGEASSRQIASVLEKLCELRIRHDAIIKRFVHAFTQKFHTCGEHTDKWADLTKVVKSTANLGIYNDDLYEFSRSVLGVSEHNFDSLDLQDRINFLHGLSLIDASDPTFEEKFISVVEEFSASTKKIMTDANICLKIYEIYINRLFANSANPSMRNPTTDNVLNFVNKVMQEWPCYHWFKNEEKIHMQFKNSIDYITIRESLEKLGMHSVESKITEVYFCHFVLTLENSKIAMICVPDESLLTWLNADEKNDNVTNQIGHSRVEFGDCSRRIEHMRRSDWKVSIIYLSEWRKLNLEDRPTYLLKRIKQ